MRSHSIRRDWRRTWRPVLLVIILSLPSYSADLVVIRGGKEPTFQQRQLETAARFYGLDVKLVDMQDGDTRSALDAIRQEGTLAVAIQANALANLSFGAVLHALPRKAGPGVPLLVFGVTPDTSREVLQTWSGDAVAGVGRVKSQSHLRYSIGDMNGVTQQLSGLSGTFPENDVFSFVTAANNAKAENIMTVEDDHERAPVFVGSDVHQQRIFVLSNIAPLPARGQDWSEGFATIAPLMMFVRYSAGDRGWHTLHPFANLTIDDPWLREPYGHLIYRGLLQEMERHNFHTTIAFIPWNYDRSEADVVDLFRRHSDRFSVCIHGDNHDHKEFEDLGSKPLAVQIAALRQSVARMQKFEALTGITYDRVFIFPHSIGPEIILRKLKEYNLLATVNSGNVPMDQPHPPDWEFGLRPVTVAFADFPSITRYSAAVPVSADFIKINEFLGNPLLFYGHQDLFAKGIDAFDPFADEVNRIAPDTQWRSLGDVVRHLYLVRASGQGEVDVLAFASTISLENPTGEEKLFRIRKAEPSAVAIASVTIDGRAEPFAVRGGYLQTSVRVPPGTTQNLEIRYHNDLNLASVPIAKTSLRVDVLRKLSDFRDITLSEYAAGRLFTRLYYDHEMTPTAVLGTAIVVFAVLAYLGVAFAARLRARNLRRMAVVGEWNGRATERQ